MLLANQAFNHRDAISPSNILYKKGDDPTWADKNLSHTNWSSTKPESQGIYWIRADFDLNNHRYPERKKEMEISVLGSYEAYFDGVLIGVNGQVGKNAEQEVPGQLDSNFILPDSLSQNGQRVLALRVSNNLGNTDFNQLRLNIDSYNEFYKYGIVLSLLLYILAGIFLTVSLYYFFLFFVSRRRVGYLIFGIFCMVLFILIVQTYSRYYWPYLYTQFGTWLFISSILSLCAAILLPIFLIHTFLVPGRKLVVPGSVLLVLASYFVFTTDETAPLFISVSISTLITIWAIFKKRFGSWEALTGLLIFLTGMVYFELSVYVGFGVLVIANLFSLAVIQREERREYEESLVRSSRLKLELLKKNLKPHFLINTLTNIISLIENKPKASVRLIEALSEEFYSLNEMSDRKLIPLERELKLCKSHLEVMRIRNEVEYQFNNDIDSFDTEVPPAIIHTLLENGITHCGPINNTVVFSLAVRKSKKRTSIQFNVKGKFEKKDHIREGTGIAYVRSRLEESYPGMWHLEYGELANEIWQTNIYF